MRGWRRENTLLTDAIKYFRAREREKKKDATQTPWETSCEPDTEEEAEKDGSVKSGESSRDMVDGTVE